jgi:acyl-CoA reductase-like NAD-dependent aldehyde dehydrogenase
LKRKPFPFFGADKALVLDKDLCMSSGGNFVDGKFTGITESGPMDVVVALQSAKKLLAAPQRPALFDRVNLVQKLGEILHSRQKEVIERISQAENLSPEFVGQNYYLALEKIIADRLLEVAGFEKRLSVPSGLVSVILPWTASFVYLIKAFVPAYLAGNHVVIKTSSKNQDAGQLFSEMLEALHSHFTAQQFNPGSVQVLHGDSQNVGELFVAHPSIRTVIAWGHLSTGEKIVQLGSASFKKIHLGMGVNNAAFILGDPTKAVFEKLTQACFNGLGQYPWNISKVFVLESQHEKFLEDWKKHFQENPASPQKLKSAQQIESYHSNVKQLTAERGKIVFGGDFETDPSQPTLLLDLTHCSTLQQDELNCPMVIVSPVKYVHEMSKWANTAYLGYLSLIFGETEKALNLASKLDTGFVSINEWSIVKMLTETKVVGHKQSFAGVASLALDSNLFSDKKVLL